MKRSLILLPILLAACTLIAQATTVYPVTLTCPLCKSDFVITALGSYSVFAEDVPARDLSDNLRFFKAVTCPYCLYSAFREDYDKLDPVELGKLKTFMPSIKTSLREASSHYKLIFEGNDWNEKLVKIILARACYAHRSPDLDRDLLLLRLAYRNTSYSTDSVQHRICRQDLIQWLSSPQPPNSFTSEERTIQTYLLGEMLRLSSNDKPALETFAKARQLAQSLENAITAKGITAYCDEQSYRIAAQSMTAGQLEAALDISLTVEDLRKEIPYKIRIAIEVLESRNNVESWAALLRFCQKSDNNLKCLDDTVRLTRSKLKKYPPMDEWIKQRYLKAIQQTPASKTAENEVNIDEFAHRWQPEYNTKVRRLRIIDESDEDYDEAKRFLADILNDKEARFPPDRQADDILKALGILIRVGDENACRLLVSWAKMSKASDDSKDHLRQCIMFRGCLENLSRTSTLWPYTLRITADANANDRSALVDCIRFMCGDDATTNRLTHRFSAALKWNTECDLILRCFWEKRDSRLKQALMKRWADASDSERWRWIDYHYLADIGDRSDLCILEKLAMNLHGFDRNEVESAVTQLRVRLLMTENAASQPVTRRQKP